MPTEAEFAEMPDAIAGKALLEASLTKAGTAEQEAFWQAVQRCYASAIEDDALQSQTT